MHLRRMVVFVIVATFVLGGRAFADAGGDPIMGGGGDPYDNLWTFNLMNCPNGVVVHADQYALSSQPDDAYSAVFHKLVLGDGTEAAPDMVIASASKATTLLHGTVLYYIPDSNAGQQLNNTNPGIATYFRLDHGSNDPLEGEDDFAPSTDQGWSSTDEGGVPSNISATDQGESNAGTDQSGFDDILQSNQTETVDGSGNLVSINHAGSQTYGVNTCSVLPTTTASPAGTTGNNGWYKGGPVTVSFSASSANSWTTFNTQYRVNSGSNLTSPAAPTFGGSGSNYPDGQYSLTFWSQDPTTAEEYSSTVTGNSAYLYDPVPTKSTLFNAVGPSSTLSLNVDTMPPVVTCPSPPTFLLNQASAPVVAGVSDATSGVAGGLTSITANASTSLPGANQSVTVPSVSDVAGNLTLNQKCSYNVQYASLNFLPPVATSSGAMLVGKVGRNIPVKFVLKDANGAVVQEPGTDQPAWLNPVRFTCPSTATVADTVVDNAADSSNVYSWDGSEYIHNWKTTGLAAGCYHVYAQLDDGTTHSVDVQLQ